ncbi:CHASE3 domain-containing protein [Actinoplanes sp. NPDC051470]|uniref:CHASE3 domain-containing protein n=1 Tax=Actinoplanes sp. NPDC051470 TaxID=3157224 RepID=UPI00343B9EF5
MRGDGSVRRLLGRTFALLALLILGAGLAEMVAVLLQHRVVDQLSTHVQPLQVANAHLRGVLADAQRSLRGYLLTGDGQMLDGYYVARSDYGKAVDDVETLVGDREQGGITTQLRHADQWWAVAERQRRTPPRSEAAAEYVTEGKPLFQAFAAANQELDLSLAARAAALQRRSARLEWLTVSAVAALTVIAAVTAAITAARANRRITTPLGRLVEVLDRQRAGDHAARADPAAGPAEIRAVAEAINIRAEEADRARTADQDVARLRGAVRELGYRIRGHLVVDDAIREAVHGLAGMLGADHVLVRTTANGVPPAVSLHDEHRPGGPLADLAACDTTWLRSGDVWATDDPAPAGDVRPTEQEQRAWRVGRRRARPRGRGQRRGRVHRRADPDA